MILLADHGGKRYAASAEKDLDVCEQDASSVLRLLEKRGLIHAGKDGMVELTEEGRRLITPDAKKLERLKRWAGNDIGLFKDEAEAEVRAMILRLNPQTVGAMIQFYMLNRGTSQ